MPRPIATLLIGLILLIPALTNANSEAKLFTSINGQVNARLVIVPTLNGKYFLHFSHFGHKFDKNTYLYDKVYKEDNGKKIYFYTMTGTAIINFRYSGKTILIYGSNREYSEVILSGENPFKMIFTRKADLHTIRYVKAQYLRTQGLLESKIAAKKLIKKSITNFHNKCHKKLNVKIIWSEFISSEQKTTPGMAHAYINSLTKLCQQDDHRTAVNKINAIIFRLSKKSGKDTVVKANNTMTIYISELSPNIHHTSYQKIKQVF